MNSLYHLRSIVAMTGSWQAQQELEIWISRHIEEYGNTACISDELAKRALPEDLEAIQRQYDQSLSRQLGAAIVSNTTLKTEQEKFGKTYTRRVWILKEKS